MIFTDYIKQGIHVGAGFRLGRATIIGPYPTRAFIDEVLSQNPDQVTVAVDDGWPQERTEDIQHAFSESRAELTLRRVAPELGNGLVHAKLYFLEWVNTANNRRRHTLLAGSANASLPGFGIHAESFVHVDLANIDASDKKAVLQYFTDLGLGRGVDYTWFYFNDKSWFSLPALRIVSTLWPNGFDAWIRRGRLCHSYQPDPAFGRLVLRLKESMPQALLSANLGESGFNVAAETQAFTRSYVDYISDSDDEGKEKQTWRQRYFTETVYGYWTSGECFKQLEDQFVAPNAVGRNAVLRLIQRPARHQHTAWINDFLSSIKEVVSRLSIEQKSLYFYVLQNGELDEERYRNQAEAKLSRDRSKAMDEYFCSRFTSGFAFPPVPALGDEFEEFIVEFCANLLAKLQSSRVNNRLAAFMSNSRVSEPDMTPEDLLDQLRNRWDELSPGLITFFMN